MLTCHCGISHWRDVHTIFFFPAWLAYDPIKLFSFFIVGWGDLHLSFPENEGKWRQEEEEEWRRRWWAGYWSDFKSQGWPEVRKVQEGQEKMRTQLQLYQSVIKWGVETGKNIYYYRHFLTSQVRGWRTFVRTYLCWNLWKFWGHFEIIKDILEVMQKCPVSQVYTNAMSINNQHLILQ